MYVTLRWVSDIGDGITDVYMYITSTQEHPMIATLSIKNRKPLVPYIFFDKSPGKKTQTIKTRTSFVF